MDSTCYRPLTLSDSLIIQHVLDNFLANTRNIADTLAKRLCQEGASRIRTAFANGIIFGARYDTPRGPNRHEAATDTTTGLVHIDTWHLDDAKLTTAPEAIYHYKADLALSLIHEGLHLGTVPPHGTNEPYTTSPWNLFNSIKYAGVTPSPCVIW